MFLSLYVEAPIKKEKLVLLEALDSQAPLKIEPLKYLNKGLESSVNENTLQTNTLGERFCHLFAC